VFFWAGELSQLKARTLSKELQCYPCKWYECSIIFLLPSVIFFLQLQNSVFNAIGSLYSNFVGDIHFACMARLLGYQGIAVVIEELLKIIKSVVCGFFLFLTTLPSVCLDNIKQVWNEVVFSLPSC